MVEQGLDVKKTYLRWGGGGGGGERNIWVKFNEIHSKGSGDMKGKFHDLEV